MLQEIIKITTAGSVDDGKSTLLARLMLDTGSFFSDQVESLGPHQNIADLLDGLESEKSQGITIDVANRFLDIEQTRFHFRDAPGHEQYTRNLATACAGSDAIILLVDPREGLKPQTRLHLDIALLFGIRQVIVAVSKMDLVRFSKTKFESVKLDVEDHLAAKSSRDLRVHFVPVSGQTGHGISRSGKAITWYSGLPLVDLMLQLDGSRPATKKDPVVAVQSVHKLGDQGRYYLASLLEGSLGVGDKLSDGVSTIEFSRIQVFGENKNSIEAPRQFSFSTSKDVDLEEGSLLTPSAVVRTNSISASLVWFSAKSGVKGRSYDMLLGSSRTRCTIAKLEVSQELDVGSSPLTEVREIHTNQVLVGQLSLARSMPLFSTDELPPLSRGVLIDPISGETVGAFVYRHSLRRGENVIEYEFATDRDLKEAAYGAKAKAVWLTGLSGSGKSTIADRLSSRMLDLGRPNVILDGDSVRQGLNSDLGFLEKDRTENVRRVAEVARILVRNGVTAIVSLVSPSKSDRYSAREIVGPEDFVETFVDTPLDECIKRDPKGLYAKAAKGDIPNFTGISAEYEKPEKPEIHLIGTAPIEESVEAIISKLQEK